MLRLSLRNALAHKLRFLMTTFAVVMGVGFVVGSFVVSDTLRRSVDQLFTDITAGTDVSVRAESSLGSAGSATIERGRVPSELLEVVRSVDGVAAAEVTVGGYAQLVDLDGEPLTSTGAPFLGVSWGHEDRLRPATLESGRAPVGAAEVVIDRGTAADFGFAVGDSTTVLLADGSQPSVEIVGIFTFGEANNLLGARVTAFDVDAAPEVFGTDGMVDSIDVAAADGVDPGELAAAIAAVVPDGVEAATGAEVVEEESGGVSGFLDAFQNGLLGFAAIALFVAAFFINNTFSIVVGQRTRQLALLRALGASGRQITTSVLAEALLVGVLASGLGVGFGLLIAIVLQAILGAAGFDLPTEGLVLLGRTFVAAAVVGIGVTLVAALAPARRASGVPPVEGMREGFVPHSASSLRRAVGGGVLTGVGVALVLGGVFVADATMSVVAALALGALAVFIGVAQLSPVVAVPIAGALGRPVVPLFRLVGRLAHANAVRNPDRTAKTASALMIGLALVTTVFIVGESMKRTFAVAIEGSVSADYVLSTEGFTGFSPAVTAELAELPEVGSVTGVRFGRFLIDGNERDVVAADASTAASVVDVDLIDGSFEALGAGGIFVHRDPAGDLGLQVGDQVTVQFPSGDPQELTVAGIHGDAALAGNYLIDIALFEQEFPSSDLDLMAFATLADGVAAAEALPAIEAVLARHPQVKLEDRATYQASQEADFNSVLIAINGLLGLALFIALLGIANTLALSVLERTREIGLLRAVGMRGRQVRQMVLLESAMVAVFGAVLGIGVGAAFGVVLAAAMPPSVVSTIGIPVGTLGIVVVAAAVCGVLAGLLPARRAARLDVLRAVASE
ncbi:MAG: ABC transporter permease [Acidimicrobiales bacterium]